MGLLLLHSSSTLCPSLTAIFALLQGRLVFTGVSEEPIGPILWDCVTLEGGADRLSRNVYNYQSTLRNITEDEFLGCSYRASSVRIAIRLPTDATLYFAYLFPLFLPYMFRALISPSSGVSQAAFFIYNHLVHVVFMLLISVCLWTGLSWWFHCTGVVVVLLY